MAAYIVVDVSNLKDPTALGQYREQVLPVVEQHGGRYLAATDEIEALEGGWSPSVLAILEFPDMDQLHAFWEDPAYQPLKPLRQQAIDARLVAVNGAIM